MKPRGTEFYLVSICFINSWLLFYNCYLFRNVCFNLIIEYLTKELLKLAKTLHQFDLYSWLITFMLFQQNIQQFIERKKYNPYYVIPKAEICIFQGWVNRQPPLNSHNFNSVLIFAYCVRFKAIKGVYKSLIDFSRRGYYIIYIYQRLSLH